MVRTCNTNEQTAAYKLFVGKPHANTPVERCML